MKKLLVLLLVAVFAVPLTCSLAGCNGRDKWRHEPLTPTKPRTAPEPVED